MAAAIPDVAVGPVEAFWRFRHRTVPAVAAATLITVIASLWSGGDAVAVTAVHLTDPRGVPMFRDGTTASTDLEAYAAQRAEFADSDPVLRSTADALGHPVDVVADVVEAAPSTGSRIAIECRDADAELALSICTALADAYVEVSRADTTRRAEVALASLRATRQSLIDERLARQPDAAPTSGAIEQIEVQIAQTALKAALFDAGVEFVDAPMLVGSSSLWNAGRSGIAGLALSTIAAAGVAWVAAVRRPMIDDPHIAAAQLDAPLLGDLAEQGTSIEAAADDLAALRSNGILVVTSANELAADDSDRVGTTAITLALAEAWSRQGRSVVVVDARPEHGRLSARLACPPTGFSEIVAGTASLDDTVARVSRVGAGSGGPTVRFHVIGSGHPIDHLASLVRSPRADEVFTRLRATYDVVVIDAPPVLDSPEGAALAGIADAVVVVLARRTAWRRLVALRQRLDVLRAPLVGIVTEPPATKPGERTARR